MGTDTLLLIKKISTLNGRAWEISDTAPDPIVLHRSSTLIK